ncbi:MAG: CDP-alcohol phosphatidyltransferase family protein [bacterium]
MTNQSPYHASDKILTVPSAISFIRILLAIPAVYLISNDSNLAAAVVMGVAYITDILDGYVARKTGIITEFGKAIDPIADKVFVAALLIAMITKGLVPMWLVLVVIGRDIVLLVGAVATRDRIGAILPSNYWGKSAILLTIICLFLSVCGVSHENLVLGWLASTTLIVVSFLIYVNRTLKLLRSTTR